MIKRIKTLAILILMSLTTFGQTLDGYKYAYIQTVTYQNGRTDVWGISIMIRTYFSDKGFIVLTESSTPPKELEQNPCLLINCFINHTNVVTGVNEVTISLVNCQNTIVHSNTGSAMGWSLQDDYNKATKRALSQINSMSYYFHPSKTPKFDFPRVEKLFETEESVKKYLSSNNLDILEGIYKSYQTSGMPYYKIGIIRKGDNYKAIILESELTHWDVGEIKAVFEQSSMKGFYSVKWYMGNKMPYETFAKMDNEALLSIELIDQKTGLKRQDKFIKMFPTASGDVAFKKDNSKSSGSGFFLSTNGIVATNAHVLEGARNIEVIVSNEVGAFTYNAKVLLVDSKNDVALLQIDDDKFNGLPLIPYGLTENSDVGSKVFTIGYPLNDVMGNNFKVTDGIISSISGIGDDMRYYQISVPLQPGNSGGPLFDKDGNIIGITTARLNEKAAGTQVENVNYAIKSSYLLNLYNMLPNSNKLSLISQVDSQELQEQVKVLKNYVCLIKTH